MSRWVRWFWRRRDHGFRDGLVQDGTGRWTGSCARCGGYEYGEPRHPRGYWVVAPKGVLR